MIKSGSPGECSRGFTTWVASANWRQVLCGVWGGASALYEIYSIFAGDYSPYNYNTELEGEDYCVSGGY